MNPVVGSRREKDWIRFRTGKAKFWRDHAGRDRGSITKATISSGYAARPERYGFISLIAITPSLEGLGPVRFYRLERTWSGIPFRSGRLGR